MAAKQPTCVVTVTQSVTSVAISKDMLTLKVGEEATLTATVNPDNASNKSVTWSSSTPEVVTVDETTSLITAVAEGEAFISVTTEDGGKTAVCIVTVERESITPAPELLAPYLKVYPNPFASTVHLTGVEGCTLRVINTAGTTVHIQNIESPDETIRLEHLPAGMYFFRMEKEGRAKTVKVIKE